ncbi:unnamed protein product [Mycena citricolor]|uniref:21S rRNA pseudouridine(2819) synthase n=1 Tax=Mycena citricolor TaxID=2018698 RepID=A0AAD2GWI5_9AGAR|nr:unnamed protein product [Mycena citricolor]
MLPGPPRHAIARWPTKILYADKKLIVLNKAPGLVAQLESSRGCDLAGVLNAVKRDLNLANTPFPVHRLDKGTTGCLLLGTSSAAARDLLTQFRRRLVDKTYLALVRGGSRSFPGTRGEISAPLVSEDGRMRLGSQGSGERESRTEWEVVASSPRLPLTLLRLQLHTGHKHQLRVHLAHALKAPILGDTLYSQSPPTQEIQSSVMGDLQDSRILLHASRISLFRYSPRRLKIQVVAPLPDDFVRICSQIEIPLDAVDRTGGLFISSSSEEQDFTGVQEVPALEGRWFPQDGQ